MRIASVRLKNFRCFSSLDLEFERPIILLHGPNGSGKTSLLEALHFACYLRSFKTHLPKDIIQEGAGGFGVGLSLVAQSFDALNVHYSNKKKSIKLNDQVIGSYKQLYDVYRVVTINEGDLLMVQGSPSERRSFLDAMILLLDPSYASLTKKYRAILDNRNALIARGRADDDSYLLWTEQLLTTSISIQKIRLEAIERLEQEAQSLIGELLTLPEGNPALTLTYTYSRPYSGMETIATASQLLDRYPGLKENELRQRRSLFGAHLDDFNITYLGKLCRTFSSRGQQKLIVFILKLAQLQYMKSIGETSAILLVDDFMTDFDAERARSLIPLMTKLSSQVILTSPLEGLFENSLPADLTQTISMNEHPAVPKNSSRILSVMSP